MARYNGSGWHNQHTRHSNARKYGRAGGVYADKTDKIADAFYDEDYKKLFKLTGVKAKSQHEFEMKWEKQKMEQSKKHYGEAKIILTTNNILNILPHGSGIDSEWRISENKDNIIAENQYETMNEMGYYDVGIPFKLIIPKKNPENFKLHFASELQYYARKYMLRNYLEDQFQMAFSEAKVI